VRVLDCSHPAFASSVHQNLLPSNDVQRAVNNTGNTHNFECAVVITNILKIATLANAVAETVAMVVFHNGPPHTRRSAAGRLRDELLDVKFCCSKSSYKKCSAEMDHLIQLILHADISEIRRTVSGLPGFDAAVNRTNELIHSFLDSDCDDDLLDEFSAEPLADMLDDACSMEPDGF